VFAVNTDGTGFTNLYNFTATDGYGNNNDGAAPVGGLILSGNALYGTTHNGGIAHQGTVFSISFPLPQLRIIYSSTYIILTWPTNVLGFNYAGFTLQSTTNLALSGWNTNLPSPVIVNGQNTMTNPISGTQQFFRLSQ
jgi:uncharacterized repeat protein (TIGR03803 family)